MKKLISLSLLMILSSAFINSFSQALNITYKATVKTAGDVVIPKAYIKVYQPDIAAAVDSMFCDDNGLIERVLPFTFDPGTSIPPSYESGYIIKHISPSIIGEQNSDLYLEYNYPFNADIIFMDIQGRKYRNHTILSSGLYFYYLTFDDGRQSEMTKLIIAEKVKLDVDLVNAMANKQNTKKFYPADEDDTWFYTEIIKDGFVSIWDTLLIDSVIIANSYSMNEAPLPTASFSYSGTLTAGEAVVFDASASAGANSEDLSYHWDFGDGKNGGTANLPHLYTIDGDYNVTLTVSGDFGAKHTVKQSLTIQAGAVAVTHTGFLNGYITDESIEGLEDVTVTLVEENKSADSDPDGMVYLNALPVGVPLHLKITKEGYVSQVVELTIPDDTGESVFFTTLKSRDPATTLYDAEFGGELEAADGTKVILPVLPFSDPDGNPVYGNVDVNITPVDVAFETESFPGTFTGYNEEGDNGVLLSYGVSEFHFEQNGEILQLSDGKKATVLIPIYTSGAQVGDQIPLWSVNEDNGKWVQEGVGTVVETDGSPTGLALKAEVNHFSWFNCDDFEDGREKKGLCWIWDCTTAQCYKRKVGCWVNGARREPMNGKKGRSQTHSRRSQAEERDTLPPIFEVRDYLPKDGRDLLMPYSRDVLMEARGFTDDGQLMQGSYTLLTSHDRDSFEIELIPVMASDTIDLALNTLHEDYLEPGEFRPFRVQIREESEYQITFNRGDESALQGTFHVMDNGGVLLTSNIDQTDNYFTAYPGEIFIKISGFGESSEGSFLLGIADPKAWLPGDTTAIEIGSPYEGSLDPTEFKYLKLDIPQKKLFQLSAKPGSSPSLSGRYKVELDNKQLLAGELSFDPTYLLSDTGTMLISVAGRAMINEGNYNIQLEETVAIPLTLNDSISDSLTVSHPIQLYKIVPDHNTILKTRFYVTEGSNRYIKILSASGKEIRYENLYADENMMLTALQKDSTYLIEVSKGEKCHYVIITEEDELYDIAYGDTVLKHLTYREDKDMLNFTGQAGDMVSIKGDRTDYELNQASFSLFSSLGEKIGKREISNIGYFNDYEILYKLPSAGIYSILIESSTDDTGSYRIILDTISYSSLDLNSVFEENITAGQDNYFEIEIIEDKICHLSVISDDARGTMTIWSERAERMNEANSQRYYTHYYIATYTNILKAGNYYVKLSNENSGTAYINFAEPEPLILNDKGEVSFTDTIHQARKVNVYSINASTDDGVHSVMKTKDELNVPGKLELNHYPLRGDGSYLNLKERSLDYYSVDSSFLHESAGKLEGEFNDSIWVLVAYAETAGIYDFKYHHVKSSEDIVVDDDYAEYPNAHTSSPVAAGYAVKETGSIIIGNGEYTSYLPMNITSDYVQLSGQETENTWLQNVYNLTNNPVIMSMSDGLSIRNLSLSCGATNYYTMEVYGDDLTLEGLIIKPLPGKSIVSGGIKGGGDNTYINELTLDRIMWGIEIYSDGGIIENCLINTKNQAIKLSGENIIVRNNDITITENERAIKVSSGYNGTGTQIVENNQISIPWEYGGGSSAIISIEKYGGPENTTSSYIRNNTMTTASGAWAVSAMMGNPPSKIIIEGNRYTCSKPTGGRAFMLQAARSDGSSSVIIRNNIFEGLTSFQALLISSVDLIVEDQYFAIVNNSFRMQSTADQDPAHNFARITTFYGETSDTLGLYFTNNIFQGNGYPSFAKCNADFSFYMDYNITNNFSAYNTGPGHMIGLTNEITADPLFIDADLHVGPASPAINSGASPTLFEFIPDLDINGISRPQGSQHDIGAYEKEE